MFSHITLLSPFWGSLNSVSVFNDYFTKIGHLIANAIDNTDNDKFATYLRNSVPQTIVLTPPLPTEILKHNQISKPQHSPDDVVAPKLSLYFGTALEFGIYSQNFKAAKVLPIFKSGNKKLLQNYRPIFLFPSLSKVLDKLIKNAL